MKKYPPYQYQIYQRFWQMIDLIFPPQCAGCGNEGISFCEDCLEKTTPIIGEICHLCGKKTLRPGLCRECQKDPPPFKALRSWAEFNGPVREALHHLKYKNDLGLGFVFSRPLVSIVEQNNWEIDMVVPVPISKQRKKERGYNQSSMLAFPISLALNVPFSNSAIIRKKATQSQIHLSNFERFKNLEDAFLGNTAKLNSKKVLLVDDIVTTGATLRSCSKALLEAGCNSVVCLTVAQTPKMNHKTL